MFHQKIRKQSKVVLGGANESNTDVHFCNSFQLGYDELKCYCSHNRNDANRSRHFQHTLLAHSILV